MIILRTPRLTAHLAVAALFGSSLLLASCADADTTSNTSSVSSSASDSPTSPVSDSSAEGTGAGNGGTDSGASMLPSGSSSSADEAGQGAGDNASEAEEAPKSSDEAISEAVNRVNRDYPNKFGGWVFKGDTNFDSAADLTYAKVEQAQQGNAQYETLLIFFHKGEYLGIDSTYPQQVVSTAPSSRGLEVVYKDWEALRDSGDANAAAGKYTSTVTYYWDGAQVQHEGRIPNTGL